MSDSIEAPTNSLVFDRAINYAFQQNAIPVIKELKFCNDATARKNRRLTLATEPAFAEPVEIRLQGIAPQGEYRIDLGVVDPKQPGRYLLGVECDGATYHRAATARDRDKLRQAILEGLG